MEGIHFNMNEKTLFLHLHKSSETWKIKFAEVASVHIQHQLLWAVFWVFYYFMASHLYTFMTWSHG